MTVNCPIYDSVRISVTVEAIYRKSFNEKNKSTTFVTFSFLTFTLTTHEVPSWWGVKVQQYSTFDAFGKEYLCCLEKSYLIVIILFSFYIKHEKNFLTTLFWAPILFKKYLNTSA